MSLVFEYIFKVRCFLIIFLFMYFSSFCFEISINKEKELVSFCVRTEGKVAGNARVY